MTLQKLSKEYRRLHPDVKQYLSFSEYVFTYGSKEDYDSFNETALQVLAETNPEVI